MQKLYPARQQWEIESKIALCAKTSVWQEVFGRLKITIKIVSAQYEFVRDLEFSRRYADSNRNA